jgi:hypothetical protein
LGCGEDGIEEIKRHPFFEGVNWGLLNQKKLAPPYMPSLEIIEQRIRALAEESGPSAKLVAKPSKQKKQRHEIVHFEGFSFVASHPWQGAQRPKTGPGAAPAANGGSAAGSGESGTNGASGESSDKNELVESRAAALLSDSSGDEFADFDVDNTNASRKLSRTLSKKFKRLSTKAAYRLSLSEGEYEGGGSASGVNSGNTTPNAGASSAAGVNSTSNPQLEGPLTPRSVERMTTPDQKRDEMLRLAQMLKNDIVVANRQRTYIDLSARGNVPAEGSAAAVTASILENRARNARSATVADAEAPFMPDGSSNNNSEFSAYSGYSGYAGVPSRALSPPKKSGLGAAPVTSSPEKKEKGKREEAEVELEPVLRRETSGRSLSSDRRRTRHESSDIAGEGEVKSPTTGKKKSSSTKPHPLSSKAISAVAGSSDHSLLLAVPERGKSSPRNVVSTKLTAEELASLRQDLTNSTPVSSIATTNEPIAPSRQKDPSKVTQCPGCQIVFEREKQKVL